MTYDLFNCHYIINAGPDYSSILERLRSYPPNKSPPRIVSVGLQWPLISAQQSQVSLTHTHATRKKESWYQNGWLFSGPPSQVGVRRQKLHIPIYHEFYIATSYHFKTPYFTLYMHFKGNDFWGKENEGETNKEGKNEWILYNLSFCLSF